MFLTKLAIKNLIRHKVRTLITAGIIAIAIFFYILLDGLILGMTNMSYDSVIDYQSGHIQIADNIYWEDMDKLPLRNLIAESDSIIEIIKAAPGYEAYSEEVDFTAMLNNGVNELPVLGKGIVPERFLQVYSLSDKFAEGSMFANGEYRAVMGYKLAELMNVTVGDYLTLLVRDKNSTFNTIDVEISGLLKTLNPTINRTIVYLPLDIVQKDLSIPDELSKIIIRLENKNMSTQSAEYIEKRLPEKNLGVHVWQNLEAISIAGAKNAGNQLIMVIILLIAGIAIVNTVILAALERMEEIGMMKAMGLEVREIVYTFVMESTGIGLLGGVIGVLMGIPAVFLMTRFGIDWTMLVNVDMAAFGIPVMGKLYSAWHIAAFVRVFFFGIIVSFLSSILPAYWAAKKDPVKAIYHR